MSASATDLWPPVTTTWQFGDGASAVGAAVSHCYSTAGERTVTVTATDAAGNATSRTRTIAIAPAASPDGAAAQAPDPCQPDRPRPREPDPRDPDPRDPVPRDPVPRDPVPRAPRRGAPVVSTLSQASARWRTGGPAGRSRPPLGTTFRFRLDRAARVRLAFEQLLPGRRAGGSCRPQTRSNRRRPACRRSVARGALIVAGRAGANAVRFRGRLHGRTLPPGRYRLRLVASAGGRSSAPKTLAFAIVR